MKKDISSLHVPHNKNTAGCTPVSIQLPTEVILPMNMHSGHDAEPIVNVGDHVKVGQLIAREEGRFSSPVHATISGTDYVGGLVGYKTIVASFIKFCTFFDRYGHCSFLLYDFIFFDKIWLFGNDLETAACSIG